ncbi:MAG: hypothetical protein AABZ55_12415 [Bdellovibrionota bacterium]
MPHPFVAALWAAVFLSCFVLSCTQWSNSAISSGDLFRRAIALRPAILTKDDAILVDQTRLSISGLIEIKKGFAEVPREQMLWAITASVAVHNYARSLNKELSPGVSVRIVNFALGRSDLAAAKTALDEIQLFSERSGPLSPSFVKTWIDSLLARSVVQKNMQILAEIL